jgi:hypothetical protein
LLDISGVFAGQSEINGEWMMFLAAEVILEYEIDLGRTGNE